MYTHAGLARDKPDGGPILTIYVIQRVSTKESCGSYPNYLILGASVGVFKRNAQNIKTCILLKLRGVFKKFIDSHS